jgi:hypothetical protein
MATNLQTESQCDELGKKFAEKINSFYDVRIAPLQTMIDDDLSKGLDPSSHTIKKGAITLIIDLYALKEQIDKVRGQSLDLKDKQVGTCKSEGIPNFVGEAQKVLDTAMGIAALPLILITKDYAAVNIDLGEIYKGYPLGGDNALIPSIRDDTFDYLHIGADDPLRQFLANPFQDPISTLQDLTNVPGAAIDNAKVEINKGLENLGIPWRV